MTRKMLLWVSAYKNFKFSSYLWVDKQMLKVGWQEKKLLLSMSANGKGILCFPSAINIFIKCINEADIHCCELSGLVS